MKNLILISTLVVLTGCNVGNAPTPMSNTDAKKAIDELPLDKKIAFIESSPASPEEKKRLIEEAKMKAGSSQNKPDVK